MDATIVAAAIAALSSVLVALIGYWGYQQRDRHRKTAQELEYAEKEISFRRESLELHVELHKWSDTEALVEQLLLDTEVDRFLILRCWNGERDPKWTTAIYQFRVGDTERFAYISVDLDADYVERLADMHTRGYHCIEVEGIPESLIKRIYNSEGVKHSVWFPIASTRLDSSSAVAHTYCSFASHDKRISKGTIQKCQNLAWIIREAMKVPE